MILRGPIYICLALMLLALPLFGAERPNILLLLSDDQRADTLGATGNAQVITPELDKLASQGVLFSNSFVTTSVCAVNRASLLTGQHARTNGIRGFAETLSNTQWKSTYPALLRRAGYFTGFIGKWGVGATIDSKVDGMAGEFDFWKGLYEQGNYWPEGKSGRHLTKIMTSQVGEFLDAAPKGKPFCLSVSYKAPHGPWSEVEPECLALYDKVEIPVPGRLSEEAAAKLPEFMRTDRLTLGGKSVADFRKLNTAWTRQYYGLITGIDRSLGEIREMLKSRGLADNTIVVFTSDNGHFLFEFGLYGKWLMYEPSIRVPLVVYDPRSRSQEARKTEGIALSIDIAPTLLDFAGVPVPLEMQGRSLVPLLGGSVPADWRKDFFYEFNFGMFPGDIPSCIGVRDGRWKYVRYLDPRFQYEQLFDLEKDPDEMDNLASKPEFSTELARMKARLESYRTEIPDHAPDFMEYRDTYDVVFTAFHPPSMDKPLDFQQFGTIGQTFRAAGGFLHAVTWIWPYQMKKTSSSDLVVNLRRGGPEGELLATTTVPHEKIYSLYSIVAELDAPVKPGETLYVEMRPKNPVKAKEILLWAYPDDAFKDGQAFLDGKPADSDLALNFIYKKTDRP